MSFYLLSKGLSWDPGIVMIKPLENYQRKVAALAPDNKRVCLGRRIYAACVLGPELPTSANGSPHKLTKTTAL